MSDNTKIEWTDSTWNPLVGCSRVSDGCTNCYAEGIAYRFREQPGPFLGTARWVNGHPTWTGKVNLNPRVLLQPWRWSRGRRIFVNSMSDLFHESVPFETIALIFFLMSVTTRHTYQVLTKRPQRMIDFFEWCLTKNDPDDLAFGINNTGDVGRFANSLMDDRISDSMHHPVLSELGWEWKTRNTTNGTIGYDNCGPGWPYENVWLGVSVENQETAEERIPLLLQTPAAVRFLSCEPLLGPLNLTGGLGVMGAPGDVDWVIGGGESGRNAHPMHSSWIRSLRDQCVNANVPFFFKQWGEWTGPGFSFPDNDPTAIREDEVARYRVGKKAAGRELDGRTWDEMPQVAA